MIPVEVEDCVEGSWVPVKRKNIMIGNGNTVVIISIIMGRMIPCCIPVKEILIAQQVVIGHQLHYFLVAGDLVGILCL